MTRILHKGGRETNETHPFIYELQQYKKIAALLQHVLFGFMNNLASHLERSPLIHSSGYEPAGDRPTCLASLPIIPKSFMQYAG